MNFKKVLFGTCIILLIYTSVSLAQDNLPVPIESLPPVEIPEDFDIEDILRISDIEKIFRRIPPTEKRDKKDRLGCICMDGSRSQTKGRGACSGHGGVKYWIYKDDLNGHPSVSLMPTERAGEQSEFHEYEAQKPNFSENPREHRYTDMEEDYIPLFMQFAMVIMICLVIMYMIKMVFKK